MIHFKKEKKHPAFLPKTVTAAVLSAVILLSGCSGTGTMYTPENEDFSTTTAADSTTESEHAAEYAADSSAEISRAKIKKPKGSKNKKGFDPDEEARTRKAVLEGTGSDLFTSETVDYYYNFTLAGITLQLPCSYWEFSRAGWELSLPASESGETEKKLVPYYSYEFYDAVPTDTDSLGKTGEQKKIRICLANFTDQDCSPESCTVCGISVTADSGFSFLTSFKVGVGNSLEDMTSVFGTDESIYFLSKYNDGTCVLKYCFSNGLTEGQTIPVLAEAEGKSLAELMVAETGEDGSTVKRLSLYYFRTPE